MGTKMAVAFANIFMSVVETEILNFSKAKLLEWKRYIDDIFSCGGLRERRDMNSLLLQTGITLQLNLRLKYLIKRLTFWIQLFTKARDFTTKESLTSAYILNVPRLFNTPISLPVTLTGSEKVS